LPEEHRKPEVHKVDVPEVSQINVDEDIRQHTTVTKEILGTGMSITMNYKKSNAVIDFFKNTSNDYFNFREIKAPASGKGFCSAYLPAFIKSPLVSPAVTSSFAVEMWVKTEYPIPACKCYLKSFLEAGFKKMRMMGFNEPKCGLNDGENRIFNTREEIDEFCQSNPFKNKTSPDKEVSCAIRIERVSL
jgi:hypothetical protein